MTEGDRPRAGERVVLVAIPPGLLDGLPDGDQRAITAIVGKPINFVGYDDIGRAETSEYRRIETANRSATEPWVRRSTTFLLHHVGREGDRADRRRGIETVRRDGE